MATELCQKCQQAHPGRLCDYDPKGDCAETDTSTKTPNPPTRNSRDEEGTEGVVMETTNEPNPEPNPAEAEAHIKSAHQILKSLQQKIGEHPEIGAAITRLEMALNVLAVQTGGVL
jgi:hypothetical protein